MLIGIFGSETTEKVLLYLANYGEGYAKGIADNFETHLSAVQKVLIKLELNGVLVSQYNGKTKMFSWNPRYPFREKLLLLLEQALNSIPKEDTQKYFRQRKRPRKSGKPL